MSFCPIKRQGDEGEPIRRKRQMGGIEMPYMALPLGSNPPNQTTTVDYRHISGAQQVLDPILNFSTSPTSSEEGDSFGLCFTGRLSQNRAMKH
jgi:hypothetical protein